MNHNLKYKHLVKGIPASPGIAIGKVYLLNRGKIQIEEKNLNEKETQQEIERFKNAVEMAKQELMSLRKDAAEKLGEEAAKIFEVHQMLLDDQLIIDETIKRIATERKNADLIFYHRMKNYQNALEAMESDIFKSRSLDIKDIKRRIIHNIQGNNQNYLNNIAESRIIVSRELTPSDTVSMDRRKILAFVTELGGRTSHAAIMARSLEIPSVLGIEDITSIVKPNERMIVDGVRGEIIIEPSPETLEYYRQLQNEYYNYEEKISYIRELPSRTLDGKDIELSANLEFPDEIESVISHGAKGIGLYRTEYLYLTQSSLPSEEDQYQEYKKVAESIHPHAVIIRTVDLGGDKNPKCISIPPENNPFLGWRAIRICLKEIDIFKAQLRAILRASALGNIKILFPMISSLNELEKSIELLEAAKNELRQQGIIFDNKLEIGVMIEVPSAAIVADIIASKVDFLSIGTNDLIQYTLAVDRGNQRIADLYEPYHPAILRLIRQVVSEGHRKDVWVGMCGEMAGDPSAIPILIGLGLDELSVSPISLPEIKQIIRSLRYTECVEVAERVMEMSTSKEIEDFLKNIIRKKLEHLYLSNKMKNAHLKSKERFYA